MTPDKIMITGNPSDRTRIVWKNVWKNAMNRKNRVVISEKKCYYTIDRVLNSIVQEPTPKGWNPVHDIIKSYLWG